MTGVLLVVLVCFGGSLEAGDNATGDTLRHRPKSCAPRVMPKLVSKPAYISDLYKPYCPLHLAVARTRPSKAPTFLRLQCAVCAHDSGRVSEERHWWLVYAPCGRASDRHWSPTVSTWTATRGRGRFRVQPQLYNHVNQMISKCSGMCLANYHLSPPFRVFVVAQSMTIFHQSHRPRCSSNFLSDQRDTLQRLLCEGIPEKNLSSGRRAMKSRPVLAPSLVTGFYFTKRGPYTIYLTPPAKCPYIGKTANIC